MSPEYPQYPQPTAPYNPQPFDINALLRLLGGTTPKPSTGGGGTSKGGEPVGTYKPGFLGMPMPSSPQGPLPDMSTILPALPPQMPVAGMTPAPTPPQLPEGRPIGGVPYMPGSVAPLLPESRPEEVFPGQQAQGQGLDVQKLMAMLRAMQSRRQPSPTPQPPMPQGREGATRISQSPIMRGSGMGLEGILQGIEASRRSSR